MKKIYYLIIGLIILLSFRFFSSLFYPVLNSDNAVTILMIHYFKLPNDLYFWGQDRMGSLIPLIGQIPLKIFSFSALTSESIVHYLILILGSFSFTHFLKSHFLKIIFAIVWFFPPMRLIDVTQFSFGIHYSLIAMSCYLFDYYQKEKIQNNLLLRNSILSIIALLLISAIWVSDMALVTVFLLLAFQLYFYLKKNVFAFSLLKKSELYFTLAGFILGYIFIHYAKSLSQNRQDYTTFSDFNTIWKTCVLFWNTIADFSAFRAKEPFTSVYSYLVVIIFIIIVSQIKNVKISSTAKMMMLFFLFDAVILFGAIMISNWTFLNGVPRRYFTCTYISLSFALLLLLDNLNTNGKYLNIINTVLLLTVFTGGIGTLYNIRFIWPKTMTPRVKIAGEFEKLGQIGIISEYWNSYINSCPDPGMIKATPHDLTWAVRNYEIVDEVFEQKNIYVIKDMWLEAFPDTLKEFGRVLIKDGTEFRIGDCNVCKYKKISSPKN
ncbi:MAG TPA: hypothetical protein DEO70_02850 [Bacteroidales bacterium]|nr:MAG: hypothetical protein A2X11_14250 [Bacteroidetes bacterium GWE2_42_24]OFY30017.1 MAG: hypothetical protein A2X09_14400 [Bacteroidetes bacterium GWF2_43_11]HBZ65748.1 hypothetical protein [Bacteroidales bacterium]